MTRVLAVVGPTAAGKSGLGLQLAAAVGGEIVNADSMQLYLGLDIGTAKLPPAARQGVPHHLLDVWEVTRTADVASYQRLARAAVDDVLNRGAVPVLVGGSGLYVRAVLDELRFPGTEPLLRARLEDELAALGAPRLHARLAVSDPAAAAGILPSNGRRIVRALEVVELTGSYPAALPGYAAAAYPAVQLGVDTVQPAELDERIAHRVRRMVDAGLVAETERLVAAGLRRGGTASRALGYASVLRLLDGELAGVADVVAETTALTRRFARRQRRWFRRDPRVRWLSEPTLDAALAAVAAVAAVGSGVGCR
jgi:tRNA dimethylallyltransferase